MEAPYLPEILSLDDTALVNHITRNFEIDARWRQQCIKSGGYEKCINLYESIGSKVSGENQPEIPQVREHVDDSIALAVSSTDKVAMSLAQVIDPKLYSPEQLETIKAAMVQSVKTMDRIIDTFKKLSQFKDKRTHAFRQAGIFGSGVLGVWRTRRIDARKHFMARHLLRKSIQDYTREEMAMHDLLSRYVDIDMIDVRNVFWQSGVRSAFDTENMKRCSVLEKKDLESMRAAHPDKNITPGLGPWYVKEDPNPNDASKTVGVLRTWQIVEGASAINTIRPVYMLETVIASGKLLYKRIYDGTNGPINLPLVPYYIFESEQHPYGFPLTRALEVIQDYINDMYALMFEQARKAASPQSIVILASMLASEDNPEDIQTKLRQGDPIMLYGNSEEGIRDIGQIVQSAGQLSEPLSTAVQQAIAQAEALMKRRASTPDREAIAAAESGRAKETEVAISDRTKTPIKDIISRSDEAVAEAIYENVQILFPDRVAVPILGPGEGTSVNLNEPEEHFEIVRDEYDIPIRHVSMMAPDNPEGFVINPYKVTTNNTQIEMRAQAEGRGPLPVSWTSRLRLFASLIESGILRSRRTAREALPEELSILDDHNASLDMEEEARRVRVLAEQGVNPNNQNVLTNQHSARQQLAGEAAGVPLGTSSDGQVAITI